MVLGELHVFFDSCRLISGRYPAIHPVRFGQDLAGLHYLIES